MYAAKLILGQKANILQRFLLNNIDNVIYVLRYLSSSRIAKHLTVLTYPFNEVVTILFQTGLFEKLLILQGEIKTKLKIKYIH